MVYFVRNFLLILFLPLCMVRSVSFGASATPLNAIVKVPVADVRRVPSLPTRGVSDENEETQILFGEEVNVYESSGPWVRIEAIEQPAFTHHNRWEGYPGWVLRDALAIDYHRPRFPHAIVKEKWLWVFEGPGKTRMDWRLPLGARVVAMKGKRSWDIIDILFGQVGWVEAKGLRPLADQNRFSRQEVLDAAKRLLGTTYVWGGLSPSDTAEQILLSGVDCSGLVHLSYRVNGIRIPRDAQEQYMRAQKIKRSQLQPADLIFSAASKNPQKITHVMLYAGKDFVIEAPQTGMKVRQITLKEKWGRPLRQLESGDTVKDRVIFFGRFL